MKSNVKTEAARTVWGSGLLAVDIIVRARDEAVIEITSGGTCANVLACMALYGWTSLAKGRIGSDHAGHVLKGELQRAGVDVESLVMASGVETPIIVERFGLGNVVDPRHRFEWRCPSCLTWVPRFRPTPARMLDLDDLGEAPDVFFFDRATSGNIRLARVLRDLGSVVMFEPPRLKDDENLLEGIEVADIVKVAGNGDRVFLESQLRSCKLAIVTFGSDGLEYRANGFAGVTHGWKSLPAVEIDRGVDACGSGDWLTSGFLHAFYAVNDLSENPTGRLSASLKYGQALAALNCLLPGARGLMRVFDRVQISEMAGVTLAKGLAGLEVRVSRHSEEFGTHRDVMLVCGSCRSKAGLSCNKSLQLS